MVNKAFLLEYLTDHANHFKFLPADYSNDIVTLNYDDYMSMLNEQEKETLFIICGY